MVLSLFGRYHWTLELLTHFRALSIVAGMTCATVCFFGPSRRWAIFGILFFVCAYFVSLFPYLPAEPSDGEVALTLFAANILSTNPDKDLIIEAIQEVDPDIILLQEFDSMWRIAIVDAFREDYPHMILRARPDNFGMATLSRIPFEESHVLNFADVEVPAIHTVIELKGELVDVLNFHAVPPIGSTNAQRRNDQLISLRDYFAERKQTRIVAGDFNTTNWSPYFLDLVDEEFLRDGRVGQCLCPTWYTVPMFGALLPLDHVLYNGRLELVSLRTLSPVGSDHLPLVAEFALAR